MNDSEKNNEKQLEDMIELDDTSLSMSEIEAIAHDDAVRRYYEKKYHARLYSEILLLLTHESFEEQEAKAYWGAILNHRSVLNQAVGRDVGIAVATIDYLSNIRDILTEPVIIEGVKSDFVSKTTTKDILTGLYLRDVFDVILKQKIEETKRSNAPLCLLMIDIDDFKEINDSHGHLVGDKVLKAIGATIRHSVRKMDLPARYGGEELAVIIPKAGLDHAFNAAERIREAIEKLRFNDFRVTVSVGIGQTTRSMNSASALVAAADEALYQAKHKGKNCVVVAGQKTS